MSTDTTFASKSIAGHVARGLVGFGLLIASIALIPTIGYPSLLLAPLGVLALRGCPTCWAIGLAQTISQGRLRRSCVDGHCQLTRGESHVTALNPRVFGPDRGGGEGQHVGADDGGG